MNRLTKTAWLCATLAVAGSAAANITLYEDDGYRGRSMSADRAVRSFEPSRFNDRASSVVVTGNERWEACEDVAFGGRCVVLRQGNYPSLGAMGLNDRLSSIRPIATNVRVDDRRYAPLPVVQQDFRRRGGERLYEARVTAVRAVVSAPERRCWVEREQIGEERGSANVPGAVFGAVLGGILGHQIGGGTGRDIATAGGVVAGAAVGANVGRDKQPQYRDVQRCSTANGQRFNRPDYWDVTYNFRGQDHRVQMTSEPGQTVTVNGKGEPRATS